MPSAAATASAAPAGIAGEQHHLDAGAAQRGDGGAGGRARRIGEGEQAERARRGRGFGEPGDGAALGFQRGGGGGEGAGRDAGLVQQAAAAEQQACGPRPWRRRRGRRGRGSLRAAGGRGGSAAADGLGQRVLAAGLQGGGQAQQFRRRSTPSAGTRSVRSGRPLVSVPVLSKATRVTSWARSSAAASRMRMPRRAAAPVPTMIAAGVARPSAQGQAMTRTATAFSTAADTSAPAAHQPRKVITGHHQHGRDEHRADPVHQALDRRLGGLRALDQADDAGQHRLAADGGGADRQHAVATGWSRRPRGRRAPVSTGRLSPVSMDSSTLPPPSSTVPSTGMRSPGRTTHHVAHAPPGRSGCCARRRRGAGGRCPGAGRRARAGRRRCWPVARVSRNLPSRTVAISTAEDS